MATVNVGVLRAQLTADTAKWSMGLREAGNDLGKFQAKTKQHADSMTRLMSQAGRAASANGKLLAGMGQAGQQALAKQLAMQQQLAGKAQAWGQMLQRSATASAKAQQVAAQASLGWSGRLSQLAQQSTVTAKAGGVLATTWGQVAAGFGAVSLLTGAIGLLGKIGHEAIQTAGDLVDMSNRTGMSIESLQRMGHVAKQTGSTLEGFQKAAFQLGIRLEGANKELRAQIEANNGLRMSYQQLLAMKPDQQFEAVLEALRKIEDPQKRNELAVRLFGRAAQEVLPAIAEGYRKIASEATVASDAQVRAVDRASDAWDAFMSRTGTRFTQMMGRMVLAAQQFMNLDWNARLGAMADMFRTGNFANTWNTLADEGARKAELLAAKASLAAQKQRELAKALEFGAAGAKSYAQQLAETQKKIAELTPAQRAEILAADKLGVKLEDLAGKYNSLSEDELQLYISSTKKSSSGMSEAARNARQLAEELQNMRQKFSGAAAISEVENLTRAFGGSVPIANMAAEAQREVAKILYAGVDAWRALGQEVPAAVQKMVVEVERLRIIPDVLKEIREETFKVGKAMREELVVSSRAQADATSSGQLAAIREAFEARRSTGKAIEEMEFRRAEEVIRQAERQGATWQQVYAMERNLAQRRMEATIRDLEFEHQARMLSIDQSTQVGRDRAAQMEADHRRHIEAMVDDFEWGEHQKRQELQRTHSFWLNLWGQIQKDLRNLQLQATSNLSGLLFNLGHDMDGSLKKAAKEAREAYDTLVGADAKTAANVAAAHKHFQDAQKAWDEARARKAPAAELQRLNTILLESRKAYQEISKAGEASAEDIEAAFERMREAEEAANNGWAKRFTEVWRGVQRSLISIFDGILQAFTTKLLDGMLNAILGRKGGFAGAFSGVGGDIISGLLGKGGAAAAGAGVAAGAGGAVAGTALLGGSAAATATASTAAAGIGAGLASGGASATVGAGAGAGAGGAAAGGGFGSTIAGLATNPFTIAAAGGLALGLAVWKKGLLRGGWEGIQGNQRRDMHLAQWGPPGTGPDSGFHKLAAFLTSKTGEHGGGSIFRDFLSGDKKRFEAAQASIVALAAKAGKQVKSFNLGGFVPPGVVQPAVLHGGRHGEIVTPVDRLLKSSAPTVINLNIHIDGVLDARSFTETMDAHLPRWMRMATLLNTGDLNRSLTVGVS